jgi:hypothetical protein
MAMEMKMGGNPRQFALLAVLGLVLLGVLYLNYFDGPAATPTSSATSVPQATSAPVASRPSGVAPNAPLPDVAKKRAAVERRAQEFRPRVGAARPEDRPDPMTVDPTLRTELLARLERVQITGGTRSLFDFSNMPTAVAVNNGPRMIPAPRKPVTPKPFVGPMERPPDPPKIVPQPPQAPPIPLKFYGFISGDRGGNRRGFFLDGEEIVVAAEGELIKKRYKVVRIGLSNVTMEDTQYQQQQTLPIVPDNSGGGN